MVDKDFCMSSYLTLRYIEKDDVDFFENMHHKNIEPLEDQKKIIVKTAADIDREIQNQFDEIHNEKLGIMLSGGMDSAILASYMKGCNAYTFRFLGGQYQSSELARAEYYANKCDLRLHYVDIDWTSTVESSLDILMKSKGAPVHSIEPQIYQAAVQAKNDGIDLMIIGESSDLVFGGMDGLLSKDWTVDEFKTRYTFLDPEIVLENPINMDYIFKRYELEDNKINFEKFLDDIFSIESSSSYKNAFEVAKMPYLDPYAKLKMHDKLDLIRIRNGESKYLIRKLFKMKYPDYPVPDKVPMPRPVDEYFKDWRGPVRKEFKKDIDIAHLSGNQKWQLYCLERFLETFDKNQEINEK